MHYRRLHEAITQLDGQIARLWTRSINVDSAARKPKSVRNIQRTIEQVGAEGQSTAPYRFGELDCDIVVTRNHSAMRAVFSLAREYDLGDNPVLIGDMVVVAGINRAIDRIALEEFTWPSLEKQVCRLGMRPLMATRTLLYSKEMQRACPDWFGMIARGPELVPLVKEFCQHANDGPFPLFALAFLELLPKGGPP